jgi:quinol monooxygenase YgiN
MGITRINQFVAKPGEEDRLHALLASVIVVIEAQPGCRSCRLLTGAEDPAQIAIVEEWASIADHQAAAKAIPPAKLAEAIAMFARPPSGTYYTS